jgi:hypothetical protein
MQAEAANQQLYPPPEFSLKRNVLRWVLVMLAMILQLPLGLSGILLVLYNSDFTTTTTILVRIYC